MGKPELLSSRDYFSPRMAADVMGLSVTTVLMMLRNGKLRGQKTAGGKLWRITPEAIRASMKPVAHSEMAIDSLPAEPEMAGDF